MYQHYFLTGKPLLIVGDAASLLIIGAAWLGAFPSLFTVFATFWASCYYLAMFYQSDLRKDLSKWIWSIRINKWVRTKKGD